MIYPLFAPKVSNNLYFPLNQMECIHDDFYGDKIYRAGANDLYTPIGWDNGPQTEVAYIDRRDGNVCAGKIINEDNCRYKLMFIEATQCLGYSDEPFLIIIANFPSPIINVEHSNTITSHAGYCFLATRHPDIETREHFRQLLPRGSVPHV